MAEKTEAELERQIGLFQERFHTILREVSKVIVGQQDIIEGILSSLLANGHVLLEGVPGLGKTKLVQTLSDTLRLQFSRIQFTPDLMPGDIIGTSVVQENQRGEKTFAFQPGPIFSNIILADEINRATPKTQSALLEAMQEQSVTVGRRTHRLELPFFVLATQNPLEMEGTYPLPEAQLDRFFLKLKIEYPSVEHLHDILDRTTQTEDPSVQRVLDGPEILEMGTLARSVPISKPVQEYAIRITMATHPESAYAHELTQKYVQYGASPRAAQALVICGKIRALLNDRVHVSCEDIRHFALAALRHRVLMNFEGEAERIDPDTILKSILAATSEPD